MARHVAHAEGFVVAAGGPPAAALDLGSGGGLPGLVLAGRWPASSWVLLDANERRTAFLGAAVDQLGLGSRVEVVRLRAEEAGHRPEHRGRYDLVTARGFGPPPVVAECGAPLLRLEGRLVVSEPPDAGGDRWPAAALDLVGLSGPAVVRHHDVGYVRLVQRRPCPPTYPRRTGIPAKRPLF